MRCGIPTISSAQHQHAGSPPHMHPTCVIHPQPHNVDATVRLLRLEHDSSRHWALHRERGRPHWRVRRRAAPTGRVIRVVLGCGTDLLRPHLLAADGQCQRWPGALALLGA